MNRLTGGNKIEPGAISVSPESIEHVWDFFTGGPGKQASRMGKLLGAIHEGEAPSLKDVPILRRVMRGPNEYHDSQAYREDRDDVKRAVMLVEEYGREAPVAARDMQRRLEGRMKATESQLRKMRKDKRAAEERGAEARAKALDERMAETQRRFSALFRKATER